jgi:hypothetical protein
MKATKAKTLSIKYGLIFITVKIGFLDGTEIKKRFIKNKLGAGLADQFIKESL